MSEPVGRGTPPRVALTIDLEEWHDGLGLPAGEARVEEDAGWLLESLEEANVRATWFVLGSVARAHPALVRRIAAAGHEIASHGDEHRFLRDVGVQAFRAGLREARARLEDLAGRRVLGFRAPFFSVTPSERWALHELAEAGFAWDASIYPGRNDRYGWPGAPRRPFRIAGSPLREFPVPLLPLLPLAHSGGAYLRLLPFPLVRRALEWEARAGHASLLYVHPWEVADRLPKDGAASWRARLTRHAGRRRMRSRWTTLLARWRDEAGPLSDVLDGRPLPTLELHGHA